MHTRAFFSGQTMTNNLGFTLTPSSMIPFQDAVFPMVFMTLLAYAGNTFYPCVLRLVIWVMFKTIPRGSALREPLNYLLKHPRRCYTLLFPTTQTWALFIILFILNAIDLVLFIVLDLDIHAVSKLPGGARFAAVLFQVASSRHTGTSSFNLAKIHPAVQFSLLVMMYISVFPIAMSVRASNTYEERALGVFAHDEEVENKPGRSYFLAHVKNQLAFDLWYIFLGAFCICIAEGDRLIDNDRPV
jgi:Trk-type K+ transport system membrane component